MRNLVIAGVIVILALIVISQTLYVVQETEQVVVTRFGDVKGVHTSPGLYTKAPFVDTITSYDRRLLRIDAPPSQFLDRDINILEIDVYGRYLITDPRAFLQTLTTEENARSILAQRINSSLRAEVAERSREEIIGGDVELDESGEPVTDDEGNSRVQATNSRTELLNDVKTAVQANLAAEEPSFGVEMIDIRVKRADFPQEVAGRIFERMRSDREKISRRLRAEGGSFLRPKCRQLLPAERGVDSAHRPDEIIDHPVRLGMAHVEPAQLAIRHHINPRQFLRLEYCEDGIVQVGSGGLGGQPRGHGIAADNSGAD